MGLKKHGSYMKENKKESINGQLVFRNQSKYFERNKKRRPERRLFCVLRRLTARHIVHFHKGVSVGLHNSAHRSITITLIILY